MKGIERLEEIIVNGTKLQRSAAAYQLYWNIRDGKGASADKRRSMKYLRVAAENGSVDAMYQMGWHCTKWVGITALALLSERIS